MAKQTKPAGVRITARQFRAINHIESKIFEEYRQHKQRYTEAIRQSGVIKFSFRFPAEVEENVRKIVVRRLKQKGWTSDLDFSSVHINANM